MYRIQIWKIWGPDIRSNDRRVFGEPEKPSLTHAMQCSSCLDINSSPQSLLLVQLLDYKTVLSNATISTKYLVSDFT
jgi:hypothetical protein